MKTQTTLGRARPPGAPRTARRAVPTIVVLAFMLVRPAYAVTSDEFRQIKFDQNIGRQISSDLTFHDSNGADFQVGAHFNSKPTLLVLGYYHCPMLCTLINDGLINALQQLRLDVGKDFNVVDASIDPKETPALAATRKSQYLKRYGRAGASDGWHFLVGNESAVTRLANEAGYHFAYDPESNEYAHPSGVIVLTPTGKISRYFLGINIDPGELNSAIRAAGRGESGSVINRLVLLCFHYNPITGKYGATIMSILRVASVVTVLAIIAVIALMVGRDRRARRLFLPRPSPTDGPAVRPYQ